MEFLHATDGDAIRILIVSAFPIGAWGLEQFVAAQHPRLEAVGCARSQDAALACVIATPPDLILMDIDGPLGADTIADLTVVSTARILALTGSEDTEMQDSLMLAGANGVVHKGEPIETVLKAILRVHQEGIWINREAAGRIFLGLARSQGQSASDPEQHKIARLTRREREVVEAIAGDASATSRALAERLNISEHTLRNHLTAIYDKLDLCNRLALYAYGNRHGMVPTQDRAERSAPSKKGGGSGG